LIKSIAVAYRKPGMSREEFNQYWKDIHAPLAARIIPGVRKYVQNHLIPVPGRESEGDGVVEMWWDNLESFQQFMAWNKTEAGKELGEDAAKFMDMSKGRLWLVEEHEIKI
jgi:uncharacterized protein (TIGR02118 family)